MLFNCMTNIFMIFSIFSDFLKNYSKAEELSCRGKRTLLLRTLCSRKIYLLGNPAEKGDNAPSTVPPMNV